MTIERITNRADAIVQHVDPLMGLMQARRLGRLTHDRVGGGPKLLVDVRPRAAFRPATLGCRRRRPPSPCTESTVEDHSHVRIGGGSRAQVLTYVRMLPVHEYEMNRHGRFTCSRE